MPPHCTIDGDIYDCGSVVTRTYFVSFLSIACFVVIEMAVAVVLEQFTWMYSLNKTLFNSNIAVSSNDLQDFKAVWESFDPRRTGFISMVQLGPLLHRIADACPQLDVYEGKETEEGASILRLQRIQACVEAMPWHDGKRCSMKDLFFVLIAWHPGLGEKAVMSTVVAESLVKAKEKFPLFKAAAAAIIRIRNQNRLEKRPNGADVVEMLGISTFAARG